MQKTNEDCFYFLTSTCTKGPTCLYRHNPAVLACNVICPAWSHGSCIDPACSLRHSSVQRPAVSNGVTCFYENTPMGCRKLDCTYVHYRSRPTLRNSPSLRPSTTNLVNKDVIKPAPTPAPEPVPVSTPEPPVKSVETPVQIVEPLEPPVATASPVKPVETVPATAPAKSPTRTDPDPPKASTRVVVNRNVVVAEPHRKVVQSASNRVVVSTQNAKKMKHDSDSDLDDLVEQENETKKSNTVIDITFPCAAPRLFVPSKPSASSNDSKPIRLNRHRLPAVTNSTSNSTVAPSQEEQTSAGTGLTTEEERRTNRLERFKKQTTSPPRSVVNTTRNVINSSPNERKRPAPDQPPAKRLAATIGDLCSPPTSPRRAHARRRRRSSSSLSSSSSSSSSPSPPPVIKRSPSHPKVAPTMNQSDWKRSVDEFLARTSQPKPMPLLSLRPRFAPPRMPQQTVAPRPRPRQPTSVPNKRLPAPATTPLPPPPPTPKAVERPVIPPPPVPQPAIVSQEDEEKKLLESDEPSDVVDTFALIDEALLDDDDFLELM